VPFDPSAWTTFAYRGVEVSPEGTITCRYALLGDGGELPFAETFTLEPGPALPVARREALHRVARLLWFAAGLSYYKTAAPPVVAVPALTPAERAWLEPLYREGLGEFAFGNGIDLSRRPVLQEEGEAPAAPPGTGLGLPRRALVAVGGGKDSCVSLEVLRGRSDGEGGEGGEVVPFSIGGHRAARDCVAAAGLSLVVAHRTLDPGLGELNRSGALNGHVPVTAIVSLVAVAQALVTGADEVVFSNERSANVGSFVANGLPVNHQYSKGLAAERRLRAALAEVTAELTYYSLLRPLSEVQIGALFARLEPYLPVFTSCNAAFRIEEGRRVERWCGHCPKCRFVFLVLAPFLPRERLTGIFGADLLADPAQLQGYRELLGLTGFKPFECVGEIEESQVALVLVARGGQWEGAAVVDALLAELRATGREPGEPQVAAVLTTSDEHELPPHALAALTRALSEAQPAVPA
jgi:UDP-N-acetyl-alpha-D-muramoyl-L-alanyl-L-glutamate epimerase